MPELISFSDLMKQAALVVEKTGHSTSIQPMGWVHRDGPEATRETIEYQMTIVSDAMVVELQENYKTVQELQQAMENIINPPEDQGVKV